MSSSREIRERADSLCEEARHKLDANDANGAFDAARQALQLEIENDDARTVLRQLRDRDPAEDILAAGKTFVLTWQWEDGIILANRIEQHAANLKPDQASQCLALFLDNHPAIEKAKPFTGMALSDLLKYSTNARKAYVELCIKNMTPIFEKCFELGEQAIASHYLHIMERKYWPSAVENLKAQRGTLQLCLAKMINPAEEHIEWASNGIIMILGKGNTKLKSVLDQDAFYIVLECLDIRNPQGLKSSAIAAMQSMLSSTGNDGKGHITAFVTAKVNQGHNEDLIKAFSAAAATFPLIPGPATQLFLIDGFLQQLIPRLVANSQASEDRRSSKLELSALELINAACSDNTCKAHVSKHASNWLLDVAEGGLQQQSSSLAAVILSKIRDLESRAGSALRVGQILCNMLVNTDDTAVERYLIEGLSHVALKAEMRDPIAENHKLLEKLVGFLQNKEKLMSLAMGSLLIFVPLTEFKEKKTEEEQHMAKLKAYSEGTKKEDDDPRLDDEHVLARCKKVLDAGVIPALSVRLADMTDPLRMLVAKIMLSIAKDPKSRGLIAQQGGIKTLLNIYAKVTTMRPDQVMANAEMVTDTIRPVAHALARILISVNPNHVFSSALPVISAIRPLAGLTFIGDTPTADTLATFEALLALTNIASMDDDSGRETIIRLTLNYITDLLVSSVPLIQQAATELVCNLMASTSCIALFADGSPPSKHRLNILLALSDAEALPTRRAAGGALASLSGYDRGVRQILLRENGIQLILKLCADEEPKMECAHRGLVVLGNMLESEGALGKRVRESVRQAGGIEVVEKVAGGSGQEDVKRIAREVLQKLNEQA